MSSSEPQLDLLAPQRKWAELGGSISTKKEKNFYELHSNNYKSVASWNKNFSKQTQRDDKPSQVRSPRSDSKMSVHRMSLQELLLLENDSKYCRLFLQMLPTRSLVQLASTNKVISKHLRDLDFEASVSFSDLSCIMRTDKGFGVLKGCKLTMGVHDERIVSRDIETMIKALQNPKTRLNVTFTQIHAFISPEVLESEVIEFVRSLRFPPLLTLRVINLEGSLIGQKGVSHFCSILRQNSLPNLAELNLNRNSAKSAGINNLFKALDTMKCCPLLGSLSLSANRADESLMDFLCGKFLSKRNKLTHLDFSDNELCLTEGNASVVLSSNESYLHDVKFLDLSFNPLEDQGFCALLKSAWSNLIKKSTDSKFSPPNGLQQLLLVNCNIGEKSFECLGKLLQSGTFVHLENLSLGINNATGRVGISHLLEAMKQYDVKTSSLIESKDTHVNLPSLKHFSVPLNNFGDDGLLAVMHAATAGHFRNLESLDISDVGASTDTINLFIRNLVQHANCECLRRLVVFGRHPFAHRSIRNSFPSSFLSRVKVS